MSAFSIGEFIGVVFISLLLPALIMIALKLIPATRQAHKATYGIAGTIAVLTPWITARDGQVTFMQLCASLLILLLFVFGYSRATSKKAA